MNGEKMIIDEHPTNDQRHQEVLNRSVVFKLTQEKNKVLYRVSVLKIRTLSHDLVCKFAS